MIENQDVIEENEPSDVQPEQEDDESVKKKRKQKLIGFGIAAGLFILIPLMVYLVKQHEINSLRALHTEEVAGMMQRSEAFVTGLHHSGLETVTRLMALAIGSEIQRPQMGRSEQYMAELVKMRNYRQAMLIANDGKIVLATDKKFEGEGFSKLYQEDFVGGEFWQAIPQKNGELMMLAPVMHADRRVATIMILYLPTAMHSMTLAKKARRNNITGVTDFSKVVMKNHGFMRRIALLLALPAAMCLLAACGGQARHPDEVVIAGELKNSRGEKVFLKKICRDSIANMDSAVINDKGGFRFRTAIEDAGFYIVGTAMDNFVTLVLEKGEDITFHGDARQLAHDYYVEGSPGSALMWELNRHTRMNYRRTDSLFRLREQLQFHARYDSVKVAVDSCLQEIREDQRRFVTTFISDNPGSLASLFALHQVFGKQKVIHEKEHFDLYELLGRELSEKYPGSEYVEELLARIESIKREEAERAARELKLDSGNYAPEIISKNHLGASVKLSSMKGQVVLVFFWAGWSQPSQEVISAYRYYYQTYGPHGFNILGVSLDKDRSAWENAIRQNNMRWVQVSDLLGWDSPTVRQYNITSVPAAFLVGRDGRILCKRPDEDMLGRFLNRLFRI
jgi:peroxiredoxin